MKGEETQAATGEKGKRYLLNSLVSGSNVGGVAWGEQLSLRQLVEEMLR